jgi:hypothetical protein
MTDWVAVAKTQPIIDIGQIDADAKRALNAAVRRGELIRTKCPFFGRMVEKTCWAVSQAAVDAKIAAEQAAFGMALAMDEANRRNAT